MRMKTNLRELSQPERHFLDQLTQHSISGKNSLLAAYVTTYSALLFKEMLRASYTSVSHPALEQKRNWGFYQLLALQKPRRRQHLAGKLERTMGLIQQTS